MNWLTRLWQWLRRERREYRYTHERPTELDVEMYLLKRQYARMIAEQQKEKK